MTLHVKDKPLVNAPENKPMAVVIELLDGCKLQIPVEDVVTGAIALQQFQQSEIRLAESHNDLDFFDRTNLSEKE
ncbi:MAG: hypothetical protein AAGA75_14700 [Cyanobacteria bacterium P01_E01_bin.6]